LVAPLRSDEEDATQPRDELERCPQQALRIEGLTTFTAGVAHDLNNALSVIISGLTLLEAKLQPTEGLADVLADMRSATAGSAQLAMRLMQLGRLGEPALEPLELAPLVHRTAGIMRRRLPASMHVNVEVADDLAVRGFEADLHLVLVHLILGARDAMRAGGTLTITARRATLDAAESAATLVPAPGDYVAVLVHDTGQRDPGTGTRLSVVHDIVKRHRGAITEESSPGAGSTFTIWLPVD
jgi:signal transduction histidine kinase